MTLVPLNLTLTFKQTIAEGEDEDLVLPAHTNNDATSYIFRQMVGLTVLDQLGTIACAVFRAALGAPGTSEQSNVPSLMGQNSKERDTSGYLIMELPINVS